jgi:hypothetical protein
MQPAGTEFPEMDELLAHWREVGEWWIDQPVREVAVFIDAKGIRRERIRELGLLISPSGQSEFIENHREDFSLRERKIRDEKCSAATGSLPPSYYERQLKDRMGGYP